MIGPGRLVDGRYRVERRIGGGGMAEVFAALDERLERPVALKVLRLADARARDRFEREVRLLASLDHPGLVRLYDAGEDGADAFYVMELIAGPTLAERLRSGPLASHEVAEVAADLAAALEFIHARGIVHRDIKPSNVLLAPDGRARLADFGIARVVDAAGLTTTGLSVGTAAYAAPEQVAGGDVGPPADVYALGLVLAECATGRRLFDGTAAEVLAQRLAGPPRLPDALDPALGAVLADMLVTEPAARPTPAEVGRRLGATSAATTAVMAPPVDGRAAWLLPTTLRPARPGAPDPGIPGPGTGRRARAAAALLVAAAVVVLLVVELWPGGDAPRAAVGTTGTTRSTTTTAAPTTTTTAATFSSVLSRLEQDVATGLAQGDIGAPVADDLERRLAALAPQDQTDGAAGGDGGDVARQLSDLAAFVSQHTINGDISGSVASVLAAGVQELVSLAATTGGGAGTTAPAPAGPPPGGGKGPKGHH